MTHELQFANKQIVVLGLGVTGLSCVRYLTSLGLTFSANDSRDNAVNSAEFTAQYPQVVLVQGYWDETLISNADMLIVSPGIDLEASGILAMKQSHCVVVGDVELFCLASPSHVIAVTGSNGKSTVVSMLDHIANQLHISAKLAGNIGVPMLDTLSDNAEFTIAELSSFQLETVSSLQPVSAAVLNVSDDHLDRHKTLSNYRAIKLKVYDQANAIVINRDDSTTFSTVKKENQIVFSIGQSFDLNEKSHNQFAIINHKNEKTIALKMASYDEIELDVIPVLPLKNLAVSGQHNVINAMSALALGCAAGWPVAEMAQALSSFKGLPHRCQLVDTNDGKQWVNDSKATNVGATLAAIYGFSSFLNGTNKLVLIAGGDGKGADFSPLTEPFNELVSDVIVFGKDAGKIATIAPNSIVADSLTEAIEKANALTSQGDIILLSPACASLDMFTNYVERGNAFMSVVKGLQGAEHE